MTDDEKDRLLEIWDGFDSLNDDPGDLDPEYLYGFRDAIGWVWAGMNPVTNGATNSRMFELFQGLDSPPDL